MKKKIFLLLFIFLFSLTGCVKYNGVMEIKKDKSMNITFSYGLDTSVFGSQELVSQDDKIKYRDMGYVVSDYIDGDYQGITISKHIKNIDSVSSNSDVNYSLSNILNNTNNSYIFKVKKGFFKNTYFAKFSFDSSDSNLSGIDDNFISDDSLIDDNSIIEDEIIVDDSDELVVDDNKEVSDEIIVDNDSDLLDASFDEAALANLDLSFNIKLPYSAIRSNASSSNNNDRDLTWNLTSDGVNSIEFDFSVYNLTNILLVAGGVGLVIIILIFIVIMRSRKKRRKNNILVDTTSEIPELGSLGDGAQPFSEQLFNKQLMSQNQGVDAIVSNSSDVVNSDSGIVSDTSIEDLSQIDIVEPILDIEEEKVEQGSNDFNNQSINQQSVSDNNLNFQNSDISMIPNNMFNNDLDSNGINGQNNN